MHLGSYTVGLIVLCFAAGMIFISCSKEESPVAVTPDIPTSDELREMVGYTIIDPDTVMVFANETVSMGQRYFQYLVHEAQDSYDTLEINYVGSSGAYFMDFNITIPAYDSEYILQLDFLQPDMKSVPVTISIPMYKYPVTESEILISGDALVDCPNIMSPDFQGFDFLAGDLVFHPRGPEGFYRINPNSLACEMIHEVIPSGDFLVAEAPYLYIDLDHREIEKYDLRNDSVIIKFGSQIIPEPIVGMDIYRDTVYVISDSWDAQSGSTYYLSLFTSDGEWIQTEPFIYPVYSFSIWESYLYALGIDPSTYLPEKVIRYHIHSGEIKMTNTLDIRNWFTIQIEDDLFYYVEYRKNIICFFPLSELEFN